MAHTLSSECLKQKHCQQMHGANASKRRVGQAALVTGAHAWRHTQGIREHNATGAATREVERTCQCTGGRCPL